MSDALRCCFLRPDSHYFRHHQEIPVVEISERLRPAGRSCNSLLCGLLATDLKAAQEVANHSGQWCITEFFTVQEGLDHPRRDLLHRNYDDHSRLTPMV